MPCHGSSTAPALGPEAPRTHSDPTVLFDHGHRLEMYRQPVLPRDTLRLGRAEAGPGGGHAVVDLKGDGVAGGGRGSEVRHGGGGDEDGEGDSDRAEL